MNKRLVEHVYDYVTLNRPTLENVAGNLLTSTLMLYIEEGVGILILDTPSSILEYVKYCVSKADGRDEGPRSVARTKVYKQSASVTIQKGMNLLEFNVKVSTQKKRAAYRFKKYLESFNLETKKVEDFVYKAKQMNFSRLVKETAVQIQQGTDTEKVLADFANILMSNPKKYWIENIPT